MPFCYEGPHILSVIVANASSDSLPHDVERNAFFCGRNRCVITSKRGITRLIDQERAADHRDGYYESCWPIDHLDLHQCCWRPEIAPAATILPATPLHLAPRRLKRPKGSEQRNHSPH